MGTNQLYVPRHLNRHCAPATASNERTKGGPPRASRKTQQQTSTGRQRPESPAKHTKPPPPRNRARQGRKARARHNTWQGAATSANRGLKKNGAKWNRQLQQRIPPAPKTPATSSGKRRPSQLLPPAYTGSLHELQNGRHRDERRLRAKAAATPTPESAKRAASDSAACRQHERARRHHGAPKGRQ